LHHQATHDNSNMTKVCKRFSPVTYCGVDRWGKIFHCPSEQTDPPWLEYEATAHLKHQQLYCYTPHSLGRSRRHSSCLPINQSIINR